MLISILNKGGTKGFKIRGRRAFFVLVTVRINTTMRTETTGILASVLIAEELKRRLKRATERINRGRIKMWRRE